jgi:hypothetical protein
LGRFKSNAFIIIIQLSNNSEAPTNEATYSWKKNQTASAVNKLFPTNYLDLFISIYLEITEPQTDAS